MGCAALHRHFDVASRCARSPRASARAPQYSKALEQLHRLVKEQKALAKEAKLKLETCRVVKEQAEKLRRDIRDNGERLDRRPGSFQWTWAPCVPCEVALMPSNL